MKDGAFEEADVEALWTSRTDGVDVATALDALCSWNLVSRKYDAYIVHPVIWLLLSDVRMRDRFEQCPVVELHQSLLSELAESSTAGSPWLESVAQSPYFQSSLVRHMLTAGELERIVVEVLLQSTWILHKLRQNRSSSVTSLLDDYSLLLELLKKQVGVVRKYSQRKSDTSLTTNVELTQFECSNRLLILDHYVGSNKLYTKLSQR